MADKLTAEQRYKNMSAIRAKNTQLEIIVRKYLWNHGYRYRLNHPRLPGKPDVVMRKYRTCIFVNGCFWHGHEGCKYFVLPKTHVDFWKSKIERNQKRDADVRQKLLMMGWNCITIWECQLKPKYREQTLKSLLYNLNHLFLCNHCSSNYDADEDKNTMVAEETVDFGK